VQRLFQDEPTQNKHVSCSKIGSKRSPGTNWLLVGFLHKTQRRGVAMMTSQKYGHGKKKSNGHKKKYGAWQDFLSEKIFKN
jgi:hypothetical protein